MTHPTNPSRRLALGTVAASALVAAPALAQGVTRLKIQTAVPSSSSAPMKCGGRRLGAARRSSWLKTTSPCGVPPSTC